MPAPALQDIASLPDVLGSFRYELLITPPGNDTALKDLSLRCQSVIFPGSSVESMPLGLNGFEFHFRGRKMFGGVISVTYVETNDGIVWSHLKNWQERIVGTYSGNGTSKADYVATSAVVNIYDEQGNTPAMVATMFNVWPIEVPDISLDGQQSGMVLHQVQFQYDWVTYSDVQAQ